MAVLRGRLKALGPEPEASRIDATVATCVAWTSEVLAEVADSLGDARDAQALRGEATAILASAPTRPVRPGAVRPMCRSPSRSWSCCAGCAAGCRCGRSGRSCSCP
ncbi:hypothetical protein NKH77_27555 [Streptomyces sp. M19]